MQFFTAKDSICPHSAGSNFQRIQWESSHELAFGLRPMLKNPLLLFGNNIFNPLFPKAMEYEVS